MLNGHPIAPRDLRQWHRLELVKRKAAVHQIRSQPGNTDRTLLRWLWLSAATSLCISPVTSCMRLGQAAPPPKAMGELGDETLGQ